MVFVSVRLLAHAIFVAYMSVALSIRKESHKEKKKRFISPLRRQSTLYLKG